MKKVLVAIMIIEIMIFDSVKETKKKLEEDRLGKEIKERILELI